MTAGKCIPAVVLCFGRELEIKTRRKLYLPWAAVSEQTAKLIADRREALPEIAALSHRTRTRQTARRICIV